jgi:putative chitinase
MTTINWTRAQQKLLAAGYSPGAIDGAAGRTTFTALFSHAARRQPDPVLWAIGTEAARTLFKYGITDTPERLAEFIANTGHETGGYSHFEESLRYSAKRLMAVWPSRFPTLASALPYAWDPTDPDREDVALADLVYGARMGNQANGTNDDDGWEHRGRGMLQHTGKAEYDKLRAIGLSPDDVSDPAKSLIAACDYWSRAGTNSFIDRADWKGSRKSINGGYIGLEEVAARRARTLGVLT